MPHTALELIELGAVFFGLGLLGRLARRIGMSPDPAVPARRARLRFRRAHPAGRHRATSPRLAAEVGVVLLLLLLGLEYSATELVTGLRRSWVAGRARHRAQRGARRRRRADPRLGAGRRARDGGRHLHLVVRDHRQGPRRPRPPRQPRDAGGAVDPRVRGPRDGAVPADPHRAAGRRARCWGGLAAVGISHRRDHRGAGRRAALRPLRLGARRLPGPRGLPAQGARAGAARRRVRLGAAGVGGGRRVPARHRDLRLHRARTPPSCWSRCATCSPRCSSWSSG